MLTKEQIDQINEKCPYNQGIFTEPYAIPHIIKEPVIYMRWELGGYSGGSCWNDNEPTRYSGEVKPNFEVLDIVLKELSPNITYLQYKDIEKLIQSDEKSEWEYYGNSTDWGIQFIILSELITLLKTL